MIRDVFCLVHLRVDRTTNPYTGEVRETALSERVLGGTFSRDVARQALQQLAFDAAQAPLVRMSYVSDGAIEALANPIEEPDGVDAILAQVET